MAKIYNEVVIDMNPQSPSFEKVIYEDSFEYSKSDMMLMQEGGPGTGPGSEQALHGERIRRTEEFLKDTGVAWVDFKANPHLYPDIVTPTWADSVMGSGTTADIKAKRDLQAKSVGERTDIGMAPLTSDEWFGKTLQQQAEYILDIKYAGDVPEEGEAGDRAHDIQYLMERLENQPLKGGIDQTKAGFLEQQYGGGTRYDLNKDGKVDMNDVNMADPSQKQTISEHILTGAEDSPATTFAESLAGRTAGLKKETAMSTLQGQAGEVGTAMGSVYGGGTATGMRAGIAGQKAIGKGFGKAQDVYGLDKDVADLAYRKGMYGLEGVTESTWEADWKTLWGTLPDAA